MERLRQDTSAYRNLLSDRIEAAIVMEGHEDLLVETVLMTVSEVRLVGDGETPWWTTFLQAGYGWKDLIKLLRRYKVVWISDLLFLQLYDISDYNLAALVGFTNLGGFQWTPSPYTLYDERYVSLCSAGPDVDGRTSELDGFFQLLAQMPAAMIRMTTCFGGGDPADCQVSAATFRQFVDVNSNHKVLSFHEVKFTETHARVLASFDGAVEFWGCSLPDGGRSIFDAVARSQGPTELTFILMSLDAESCRNALCRSSHLKFLRLQFIYVASLAVILKGVAHSRGLTKFRVELDEDNPIRDDDFFEFFNSLATNDVLEDIFFDSDADGVREREDYVESTVQRSWAIANMLKVNKTLCRLFVSDVVIQNEWIWNHEIAPRLALNGFRPRLMTLLEDSQEDDPSRKLLFNRLLSHAQVRHDPVLLWTVLSHFDNIVAERSVERTDPMDSSVPGPSSPNENTSVDGDEHPT